VMSLGPLSGFSRRRLTASAALGLRPSRSPAAL